jgi:hypothetical protein
MWASYTQRNVVFGLCRGTYVKPQHIPASHPYGLCNVNNTKATPLPSGEYTRFIKTVPLIDTTSWKIM